MNAIEKEPTENESNVKKTNESVKNSIHLEGEEKNKNETHLSKEDLKNSSTDSEDRLSQSGYEEHNELQVIDDNDYEKKATNAASQLLNSSTSSTKSLSPVCKTEAI